MQRFHGACGLRTRVAAAVRGVVMVVGVQRARRSAGAVGVGVARVYGKAGSAMSAEL